MKLAHSGGGERPPAVTLAVTVSDEGIFARDVLASTQEEVASGACALIAIREASSQAVALNAGMAAAASDLVVCPHQDVSFAPGWLPWLLWLVETVPGPWGVLGPAGTTTTGVMYGTHSGLGMKSYQHVEAQTLDGSCLILRRSAGLHFDEALNRFHGYDLDVCLESRSRGLGVYVIDLPMEHRTRWASVAGGGATDLGRALDYVKAKWKPRVGTIHSTIGTF